METIKIFSNSISGKQLDNVIAVIKEGGIIILPTDTLYAIACDALNHKAIEKVCRLKGINPEKTNLSILCDSISMVAEYAKFDNNAFKLMKDNTPGPFTFLFKSASSLPKAFRGRKVVGVRIPDCRPCLEIIKALEHPLLSTSITFEEDDFGINPELIAENYKNKVDLIIEGSDGKLTPSAIVDCTGSEPLVIREGPLPIGNL